MCIRDRGIGVAVRFGTAAQQFSVVIAGRVIAPVSYTHLSGIVQKYNCTLKRLDFQQEDGFLSSLPLGHNGIEIKRGMTTSSTAIFVPFMTQELRMDGEAVYYGLNAPVSYTHLDVYKRQVQRPFRNHHGKHEQYRVPRRPGGFHPKGYFGKLAGQGHHFHACLLYTSCGVGEA